MPDYLRYRQSRLKAYTECPRRTVLDAGFGGTPADLGSAVHAVAARILETLKETGEFQIPTQEAIEIMYEVMAEGPWVLDLEDQDWLRQMTLSFTEFSWNPAHILKVETRLYADIVCPDGKTRTFTGTPDAVIADPPRGVVIPDFKSGLAIPRTPREMPTEGEPIVGWEYLSEGGHFQGRGYGVLAMRNWPRAQYATTREQNLRWGGPPREATITRDELEHAERQLGLLMMQLDKALEEGEGSKLAYPRPGPQCTTRCPVARSCPIPQEQRGLGALATLEDAKAEAERLQVISALRDQMTKALKAHHEATGEFIEVGSGELLGWHVSDSGKRRFELRKP